MEIYLEEFNLIYIGKFNEQAEMSKKTKFNTRSEAETSFNSKKTLMNPNTVIKIHECNHDIKKPCRILNEFRR